MKSCYQFRDQNVLEHGESVHKRFNELRSHLMDGTELSGWRIPDWCHDPLIKERVSLIDSETIRLYQVYHDCGKPLCREVDSDGKQHFPDHAAVSKRCWLEHGGSPEVGELIGMDMDAHTLKSDVVEEFSQRPQAILLLLTALSELHSNAAMFGGIESTSFKIKYKNLERMGKRVIALVAQR